MKIAVLAANGRVGQLITRLAVERGLDVTAVVRGSNRSVASEVIVKDILDLTTEDLAPFDVVVNAYGVWAPELLPQYSTVMEHLAGIVAGTQKRLIVVGGAGSTYVDQEQTLHLVDSPDFPAEYVPLASAAAQSWYWLRDNHSEDVNYTYISPAAVFSPDLPATGQYQIGGEVLLADSQGVSQISYEDFAVAVVDLIEAGTYQHEHINIVQK